MIFCARATRGLRRGGGGVARCPSCSQNAHDEEDGTVPVSAFCSRNAHDRNVLVRRPQSGLTRVPFQTRASEQAWREQFCRSMRAIEDRPDYPTTLEIELGNETLRAVEDHSAPISEGVKLKQEPPCRMQDRCSCKAVRPIRPWVGS